jgi:hypothetical protein
MLCLIAMTLPNAPPLWGPFAKANCYKSRYQQMISANMLSKNTADADMLKPDNA